MRDDREFEDAGIWRSSDRGRHWSLVHPFPRSTTRRALVGAGPARVGAGNGELRLRRRRQLARGQPRRRRDIPGRDAYADRRLPGDQPRRGRRDARQARSRPPVVYALVDSQMFVSFDAGTTWIKDLRHIPPRDRRRRRHRATAPAAKVMVVSPRSPLEVFVTADNVNAADQSPGVFRGDYSAVSRHAARRCGSRCRCRNLGQQFSGNVFVEATQPRTRQRALLQPAALEDVRRAARSDRRVGLARARRRPARASATCTASILSADFEATFEDGEYKHSTRHRLDAQRRRHPSAAPTAARRFTRGRNVNTLSCVNIAGVSHAGQGPRHLAQHRRQRRLRVLRRRRVTGVRQQYGGGDNDCSFADPLRPHSMLRVHAALGRRTAIRCRASLGKRSRCTKPIRAIFPTSAVGTDMRHMVPGPPLRAGSQLWNASSGFAIARLSSDRAQHAGRRSRSNRATTCSSASSAISSDDTTQLPNNLAILLRARRHPRHQEAHRLGHAGRMARRQASAPARRHQRRRARGHRRLRRRRRVDGAEQRPTARSPTRSSCSPTSDSKRAAGASTSTRASSPICRGNGRADIVGVRRRRRVRRAEQRRRHVRVRRSSCVADFGYEAGGWRVDRHPRFLADHHRRRPCRHRRLRRRRRVRRARQRRRHVSACRVRARRLRLRSRRLARRQAPALPRRHHRRRPRRHRRLRRRRRVGRARQRRRHVPARRSLVIADFGFEAGGWRVDKHPRFLADITGDGRADIVGFGNDGVYVALSNGDGTFSFTPIPVDQRLRLRRRRLARRQASALPRRHHRRRSRRHRRIRQRRRLRRVQQRRRHVQLHARFPSINDFGFDAGGWRVDKHPRLLADLTRQRPRRHRRLRRRRRAGRR